MKSHYQATPLGKILAFVLVVALVLGGSYLAYDKLIKPEEETKTTQKTSNGSSTSTKSNDSTNPTADSSAAATPTQVDTSDPTIHLSLDEWIGWKPIMDANGGMSTAPGSIFDNLGIKVDIAVINDGTDSSNALIAGDLNAAGYTTNRTAFLSGKFKEANLDIVMPVFTNYSAGGDGIISIDGINQAEDFLGKRVGVPRFSEAQTLIAWFVNKSDMTDAEKSEVLDNMILFDDAEETGLAFFAGQLDVAATWQPYLSNAADQAGTQIMFDTRASKSLIMDGIVFRRDFAEAHPEVITKFIQGIFEANPMYTTNFDNIRAVMPMFAEMSDEDILGMCGDAEMMGYAENKKVLDSTAPAIYNDMCDIWESLDETVDRRLGLKLFDDSYLTPLASQYSSSVVQEEVVELTEEQKAEVIDYQAMLSKSVTIEFMPDLAKFLNDDEAYAILDEFVELANTLDGSIIQIEGNINASTDGPNGRALSLERANAVAKYLIVNGINPNRIITVGNGNTKMLADPNGPDAVLNRRTDISFKRIES